MTSALGCTAAAARGLHERIEQPGAIATWKTPCRHLCAEDGFKDDVLLLRRAHRRHGGQKLRLIFVDDLAGAEHREKSLDGIGRLDRLQREGKPLGIAAEGELASLKLRIPIRLEDHRRLLQLECDVRIGWMVQGMQCRFEGGGRWNALRGQHGIQPHAHVFIVGLSRENRRRVGQTIVPVTETVVAAARMRHRRARRSRASNAGSTSSID